MEVRVGFVHFLVRPCHAVLQPVVTKFIGMAFLVVLRRSCYVGRQLEVATVNAAAAVSMIDFGHYVTFLLCGKAAGGS